MVTPSPALTQKAISPSKKRGRYGGGGVVKTLQRSNSLSRSVFSTAGSFGVACNFYAEVLFKFAPFCALLRTCVCVILRSFALLHSFACFCEQTRLERPHLGTSD